MTVKIERSNEALYEEKEKELVNFIKQNLGSNFEVAFAYNSIGGIACGRIPSPWKIVHRIKSKLNLLATIGFGIGNFLNKLDGLEPTIFYDTTDVAEISSKDNGKDTVSNDENYKPLNITLSREGARYFNQIKSLAEAYQKTFNQKAKVTINY